ncbi:rhomboid-like protein 15 isoform X1 [Phoenix dactylifera]|uniref:Rhomboid-like protein 15 isoform X1 n=1 Tax=Phoenix dactylifera TaxID=42345 RepID=A0A8B7CXC0_PHODC|nr:rhomboid-like protein 15 isoform X1 [Phoenix dactylifera]
MRPNVVTEAGLSTRLCQWWASVPFITSGVVILCGLIYLVCLLSGYDSFIEICFLPSEVVSRFQVYRIYTSVLFHGSLLHVLFNMLALVPLGTELERIMGSIRLLYLMFLLATTNAIFHLIIALVVAHIPLYPYPFLMNECAIGFSGIIFSMIVIETNLSGVQSRSVFGLFSVPAKWYAWILLVLFQLLATNVSLLGHLCGILSGFAYTYGLFNYLLPGPSFYYSIESSSLLSACIRRPGFILCTGGTTYGQLPMFSNATTASSGLSPGNIWRNLSSWMPQREVSTSQPAQDSRFPGRGMTLGSARSHSATTADSDISLQARLLDNSAPDHPLETAPPSTEPRASNGRHLTVDSESIALLAAQNQGVDNFEEELKKLVAMGFEKTQAEVALAAADGDPSVAIEILMSQQG